MIDLCYNKTYNKVTKYDKVDDIGDNNENEYENNNNAASRSGSTVPTFDPIKMTGYYGGGLGDNGDSTATAAHYVYTHRNMYLIFKEPIKDAP